MSIDATGIIMQGPKGSKVEGRMAYVAMVFDPQPRRSDDEALSKPCNRVRYLAGHYTLHELGQQMRHQAAYVGLEAAEQRVILPDGGTGLESWSDVHFPRAVKILDIRHATEYLLALAQAVGRGAESESLLTSWCHTMKHEDGAGILSVLESLDRRRLSRAGKEQHARTTNYLRINLGRMNYPEYLCRGW